jgi:hypothetical protein
MTFGEAHKTIRGAFIAFALEARIQAGYYCPIQIEKGASS